MSSVNERLAAVCGKSWPGWPEWGDECSSHLSLCALDGYWKVDDRHWHNSSRYITDYEAHAICEKWLREKLAEKKVYIPLHADGWWFVERHLGKPDYKCEILTCEGWRRWLPARLPSRFKSYREAAVAAVEACQKESKP